MPDQNLTLPLLPLTTGVVLPGMVFTMALESEEAKAAAEAAGTAGRPAAARAPHRRPLRRRWAWWPRCSSRASCPGACRPSWSAATQRATIGTGVPGTGEALWVEAELLVEDPSRPPPRSELAREYRAVLENILLSRGAGRIAAQLREVTEPGRLADVAGYSPDLTLAQKVEVLETLDVEARLRLVLGWARDTLADLALRERIKTDVEEGMEKTQREFLLRRQLEAIRKELGELGEGRRRATRDDYRTRVERARPARPGADGASSARSTSSSARVTRAPRRGWIRTWLDTVLELPWGVESEDRLDVAEAAAHPRRGPRRPGGREGADPRAPGRAQAPGRAGPGPGRRPRGRGHPGPGGPARRRQDLARRVGGPRPRTHVRPGRPGRRPRRGRDPGPPPHLRRAPSRAGWSGPSARPGP